MQVNTDNEPTSTLMQSCATDPSKFFLLTSSAGIVTAFGQFGTALSKLRRSARHPQMAKISWSYKLQGFVFGKAPTKR